MEQENKPNKLIFLDIDGVMNSERFFKDVWKISNIPEVKKKMPHFRCFCSEMFGYDAIYYIDKLCKETDARIVISSTWRLGYSVPQLGRIFLHNGSNSDFVVGKTGRRHFINGQVSFRDEEILTYLEENYTKEEYDKLKYVVIDDDTYDLRRVENHLITVDNKVGFTKKDYNKAYKILMEE